MMSRLRIAGRLALIVVGAVVLVQLIALTVYFAEQREKPEQAGFAPFFRQIAALVQALDHVPAADRELVRRAATSPRVVLSIRDSVPQDTFDSPLFAAAKRRLRALIGPPEDRFVAISLIVVGGDRDHPVVRWRDLVGARLHAVIGLASGGYLDIETSSELGIRLLGVPVGLLAGILGFAVALVALIAVRRETRPLSELAAAIERFGEAVEAEPIKERGAPDVRTLIRAVNAMQGRIAQLLQSRTLVLGAISHDLRTYVTRLRLRLELLPRSEQYAKAASELDGMQSLMDDALAFARACFAAAPDETVDLASVVRTECEARRSENARVTLDGAREPLLVCGSSVGLARVLSNLVANALRYGGCADICLHAGKEFAEVWVEDRGPGIPDGERERVFEPFYRLEASRNRESGGAGLGLTIVRQIVESHHGIVTIEDREGGGARLRVRLPRMPLRRSVEYSAAAQPS